MAVEVANVDKAMDSVAAATRSLGGGVAGRRLSKEPSGKITGTIVVDVPLSESGAMREKIAEIGGTVRVNQATKEPSVPEGRFTRARYEVVFTNADAILPNDKGVGSTFKGALSNAAGLLLTILGWVVMGLVVLLPVLVLVGIWVTWRRMRRTATPAAA